MNSFLGKVSLAVRGSAPVFHERAYIAIAFIGALVSLGLYLFVPVWVVPGDTLALELDLVTPLNYVLLGTLALMTGALLALEVFAFRRSRADGLRAAGEGSVGLAASLAGGILAAASCGCGVGVLLGVIGLGGGALFVAEHQSSIIAAMIVVVVIGLYFSARRAAGICATCSV